MQYVDTSSNLFVHFIHTKGVNRTKAENYTGHESFKLAFLTELIERKT